MTEDGHPATLDDAVIELRKVRIAWSGLRRDLRLRTWVFVAALVVGAVLVGLIGWQQHRGNDQGDKLAVQGRQLSAAIAKLDRIQADQDARIKTSEDFYLAERDKVAGQIQGEKDIIAGNGRKGFLEFVGASQRFLNYVDCRLRNLGIDPVTKQRIPKVPSSKC